MKNSGRGLSVLWVFVLVLLINSFALAAPELISRQLGGSLTEAGTYDWWYGCSPTSAGMLLGWYDRNGYSNLVPGGDAEINTFGSPGALVNGIIASSGHISDFYSGGYNASNDDVALPWHSFDCLADFMGTSQDAYSNSNGGTTFWYSFSNNAPVTEADIYSAGPSYYNSSGMYGIGEYIDYVGYDAAVLYNQPIYGYDGIQAGFTYDQYKAEIDAGRGVMIHVEGHSMYGYGYIDGTSNILVYDTWGPLDGENPGTMAWGGAYPYGGSSLAHYGVTVLEIVPEPTTVILFALGGLMLRRGKK